MKIKKLVIILIYFFVLSLNINTIYSITPQIDLSNSNITDKHISLTDLKNLLNHSAINIQNTTDFHEQAEIEGWEGNGTLGNPYIIGGYWINNTILGKQIVINNTDLYFIIQNNLLQEDTQFSIFCENIQNGIIYNNTIVGPYSGYRFTEHATSFNNWEYEFEYGIYCENSTITISNNAISGFQIGINLLNSKDVSIINNTLVNDSTMAIAFLGNTSNVFVYNNFITNSYLSVSIRSSEYEDFQKNMTFLNNTFEVFCRSFFISHSIENLLIINNTFNDGDYYAIYIDNLKSIYCLISNNTFSNINDFAIILHPHINQTATNINVTLNTFHHCYVGIDLYNAQNNTIDSNIFHNNIVGVGIKNADNISSLFPSSYNNITNNIFFDNQEYDLYLGLYTEHNIVVKNQFLSNNSSSVPIIDHGFCNYIYFNYYINWTTPDSNMDGIIDNPFPISGTAQNKDPFPLAVPNQTINLNSYSNLFQCSITISSVDSSTITPSSINKFTEQSGFLLLEFLPIILVSLLILRKKSS